MAVGTFSGVKTFSEIGVAPGNTGAVNTAAFNAAIGDSGSPLRLVADTAGAINLAGPIRWPVSRTVSLDGMDVASIYQQTSAQPVIQFYSPLGINDWQQKRHTIKDTIFTAIGGAACISYDNSGAGGAVRFHRLLLEGLDLWTTPASTSLPGYGIDLVADYSVTPTIVRCEAFGGGVLRWRYGPTEPHATSILLVEQCRTHVNASQRYAPDYWLDGHRNARLVQNIFEGSWGFAAGVDGVALYEGAVGLFIDNPGPMTTLIEQCWLEHWGDRTDSNWQQWVIKNPFTTAAGAHQPRNIYVMGTAGYGLVKNASDTDSMTVYIEKSPSVTVATSGSLVEVVERDSPNLWQKDGRAESGYQYESPVSNSRREPAAEPIYVYAGGTGNDGAMTRSSATAYPHRHPVYGACLAVRGPGTVFTLPVHRRADGRRVYSRFRVASPHHVRNGGGAAGLWARIAGVGTDVFRTIPDGFAPADVEHSLVPSVGASSLLVLGDWRGDSISGAYYVPASPWLLFYGATASYGRYHPMAWHNGPCVSHEWVAGDGPPPGTYDFGDKILTLNNGLPYVCDQPGTSRTLSMTCNTTSGSAVLTSVSSVSNILEGDYLTLSGVARGRVLTVASNGNVTLDTTVSTTLTGTALTNKTPSFARRRV